MNTQLRYAPLLVLALGLLLPAPSALAANVMDLLERHARQEEYSRTKPGFERERPEREHNRAAEHRARVQGRENRAERREARDTSVSRQHRETKKVERTVTRSVTVTRHDGRDDRNRGEVRRDRERKSHHTPGVTFAGRHDGPVRHERYDRHDRRDHHDRYARHNRDDRHDRYDRRHEIRRERGRTVVRHVVHRLPSRHAVIIHGRDRYHYHGGRFYRPFDSGFVLVRPPAGLVVLNLPLGSRTVISAGITYHVFNDIHYRRVSGGYRVVEPLRGPVRGWPSRVFADADLLNVRYGPRLHEEVIARVDRHTSLNVLGVTPGWLLVEIGGTDVHGWVRDRLVVRIRG
jgi:hypothetical protein